MSKKKFLAKQGDAELTEKIPDGLFQLKCDQTEVSNPTITIRWCLSPQASRKLLNMKAENPHVLIIISSEHAGDDCDRYLFRLNQTIAYIPLRWPGKIEIQAILLAGKDRSQLRKDSRQESLHDIKHEYAKKIYFGADSTTLEDVIKIEVPEDIFAPEPRPWVKKWVNLGYESKKPVDQCQFRRRFIFAFTLKPLAAVAWITLTVLFRTLAAIVITLFGKTGVSFKPIIHPFRDDTDDVWYGCGLRKYDWFWDNIYSFGAFRFLFRWLIIPHLTFCLIFLGSPILMIVWRIKYGDPFSESLAFFTSQPVLGILLWILGLSLAIPLALNLLGFVIATLVSVLSPRLNARQKAKKQIRHEQEEQDRLRRLEAAQSYWQHVEASPLACSYGDLRPQLDALPPEYRTLRLRFKHFKARVCRPFRG